MKPTVVVVVLAVVAIAAFWPRVARAALLKAGDTAPDFSTEMVTGDQISFVKLSDFRGKRVVLYFYPKDSTPGCTREACSFRDSYQRFEEAGVVVLGCSVDSSDSHKVFAKKYNLPFPLLLDHDRSIARAYGAANGIPILGLDKRITYLIGPDGKILKVFPRVDPANHANEIINALGLDKTAAPAPPNAAVN
jgi:thioredoxin-dependent peroxiredoxin